MMKKIIARVYEVIGFSIMAATSIATILMWFSGSFLVGIDPSEPNWWIRKVLYVVAAYIFWRGAKLIMFASEYLERNKK